MQILDDIPFALDAASLSAYLKIEPGSQDAETLADLIQLADQHGRPKAAYRELYIDNASGDTVSLDGTTFASRMLAKHLAPVERVFAFIATCGREAHDALEPGDDMLTAFWWDVIKGKLLGAAVSHLRDHLHRRFRLGKTASMSPGSGDAMVWPIEQQAGLFALMGDVRSAIGVELTDSFLMIPNKTLSGILFPTEVDFGTCQVCRRDPCPSRSAPFDEKLWREIEHR